jgi:hypothetical protein
MILIQPTTISTPCVPQRSLNFLRVHIAYFGVYLLKMPFLALLLPSSLLSTLILTASSNSRRITTPWVPHGRNFTLVYNLPRQGTSLGKRLHGLLLPLTLTFSFLARQIYQSISNSSSPTHHFCPDLAHPSTRNSPQFLFLTTLTSA